MGDLDGDGRAARVNNQPNTVHERKAARRTCAHYALATTTPHQALAELLDQLGLNPQKGETW